VHFSLPHFCNIFDPFLSHRTYKVTYLDPVKKVRFISYAGRKFPPDFFHFIFLPLLPVPYSATVTLNMLYTVSDTYSATVTLNMLYAVSDTYR